MQQNGTLYEKVAGEIAQSIASGSLFAGDRLPSVREASVRFQVSQTTILQAYRLLEDRGAIEARPQSGFYVSRQRTAPAGLCGELGAPREVAVADMAMQVMRDSVNPSLLQLGAALPDPALLPSAKLARLLSGAARDERLINAYGIPEGCEELRQQVSRKAYHNGTSIPASEIIITNGCMEAIYIALSVVCSPGNLVAVESPTYFCVFKALQALRLRVIEIPTHRSLGVSIEALRLALQHHPIRALLFITNFNNPLGYAMPDERKRELAELVDQTDIPLIEDDTWGEIHYADRRLRTVKSFDRSGNVILCSSFSKDIAPSTRIGWAAPGKFAEAFARVKLSLNVGTSILPQMTIARFLATGGYDHHLRTLRKAYRAKVRSLVRDVRRFFPEGTLVVEPSGGFVVWVEMPPYCSALKLYEAAIEHGMTIAPGPLFSASGQFANCIRLNAACYDDSLAGHIQTLGQLARSQELR